MGLPFQPPLAPMLAQRVGALPDGEGWVFEPKWDGFRALAFREGAALHLQSRDGKPLGRYFPDLVEALRAGLGQDCVLDGEVVIQQDGALDFEALQLRLHPAASRVATLARRAPASMVFFDLLALGSRDFRSQPFARRRAALEGLLANAEPPLHVTPATGDREVAADWFRRFEGAGLDGVIAKRADGIYEPDRRVMLKIKHERDCDCVVGGLRWHKDGRGTAVGSLLLGLYDPAGNLQHVGVCASFPMAQRRKMAADLERLRVRSLAGHPWREWAQEAAEASGRRMPGASSRWSAGKDLSWEPLRPELVLQVAYDHVQGGRFRHTAQFRRWRPDKPPRECTFQQLEVVPPAELRRLFGRRG